MHELVVGDIIRVRPGDNVAADGIVVTGEGLFNQKDIGLSILSLSLSTPTTHRHL